MKVVANKVKQVIVPAGKYWLCDPCYAVPENLWMQLLSTCDYFSEPVGTVTLSKGITYNVLGFSTAYGDGCYADQHGNAYPVDAGLIGLTPVELVAMDRLEGLGTLVEFTEDTLCTNDGGRMQFGKYKINTLDDDEYEDEEEYEDD